MTRWLAFGALALLLAVLGLAGLGLSGAGDAPRPAGDVRRSTAAAPWADEAPVAASDVAPAPLPALSPAVLAASSLRGTEADGDWSVGPDGRLRPTLALRRRFDYYLALQGEVPLASLRPALVAQAAAQHGAAAAEAIGALWDRYLALQRHPWRTRVDLRDPSTLSPAWDERRRVRREHLGPEVAQAFYGEEDAALAALVAQVNGGQAPAAPPAETPPVAPHPEAAQREAALAEAWAAWDRRLADAQAAVARLRGAPELSAPQRDAAVDAWIDGHFDTDERLRARALLGLPPG